MNDESRRSGYADFGWNHAFGNGFSVKAKARGEFETCHDVTNDALANRALATAECDANTNFVAFPRLPAPLLNRCPIGRV